MKKIQQQNNKNNEQKDMINQKEIFNQGNVNEIEMKKKVSVLKQKI